MPAKTHLYELPIYIRSTSFNHAPGKKTVKSILCVDGVGFFATHDENGDISPEECRRYLMGRSLTRIYIKATSPIAAIALFYAKYEGARIGGTKSVESKAIWLAINEEHPIYQLPDCPLMREHSKTHEYICGDEIQYGSGEYGMCLLEGFDPPDSCPLIDTIWQETIKKHKIEWIDGYPVVRIKGKE